MHENCWNYLCKHMEKTVTFCHIRTSISMRFFFCILALSSILFLKISLKMHSLQAYLSLCLILKHCRGETGTISQQSTKSWVHLRMCSDLVSTFCCSRIDINHSAERSSTCCTLPTSQPQCLSSGFRPQRLRSVHLSWVGIAYSSSVTLTISLIWIWCHQHNSPWPSSHNCPLSAPRSTWHGCEFGSLFSELPEDGALLIFLHHFDLSTEMIISFLSSFSSIWSLPF